MIGSIILSSLALYGFFMLFNNIRMSGVAFKVFRFFLQNNTTIRSYTVKHIAMELNLNKDDVVIACITDKRIVQAIPGSFDEWVIKIPGIRS